MSIPPFIRAVCSWFDFVVSLCACTCQADAVVGSSSHPLYRRRPHQPIPSQNPSNSLRRQVVSWLLVHYIHAQCELRLATFAPSVSQTTFFKSQVTTFLYRVPTHFVANNRFNFSSTTRSHSNKKIRESRCLITFSHAPRSRYSRFAVVVPRNPHFSWSGHHATQLRNCSLFKSNSSPICKLCNHRRVFLTIH